MLNNLHIENIALIDNLDVEFGSGLNSLTGETGAGKSILIDSIGFMLGARGSKDLIRTGETYCKVVGLFYTKSSLVNSRLEDFDISPEEDGTIIISRELNISGKNICKINNNAVTLSDIKNLGELLIDIHGQHDNRRLMDSELHIFTLDLFGGTELKKYLSAYNNERNVYEYLISQQKKLKLSPKEREERLFVLHSSISEIEKAGIKENEYEELKKRKKFLNSSEKIITSLSAADSALNGTDDFNGSVSYLNQADEFLNKIKDLDPEYINLYNRFHNIYIETEDIARDINSLYSSFEFSPNEIEYVEERMFFIEKIYKKYGNDLKEFIENAQKEIYALEDSEAEALALSEKINSSYKGLVKSAGALSLYRKETALKLSDKVCNVLKELEMPDVKFDISFESNIPSLKEDDSWPSFGSMGVDRIEFLISANKGEPLKPVAKIASGGELSRIMLALKTILADVDETPTLIFDEIDTGISGSASNAVGEKLKIVSESHQVICVTHSTQIAVLGDTNIFLYKNNDESRTKVYSEILDYDGKVKEIARLLDGDSASEIALQHAKSLINQATRDL